MIFQDQLIQYYKLNYDHVLEIVKNLILFNYYWFFEISKEVRIVLEFRGCQQFIKHFLFFQKYSNSRESLNKKEMSSLLVDFFLIVLMYFQNVLKTKFCKYFLANIKLRKELKLYYFNSYIYVANLFDW